MDGGRGRGAPAVCRGRLADTAGAGGGLRALVLCDPASCVSARGDSAASAGPGTAAGAGPDRDPVPVLRRRVPLSRRSALLRRCVPDPCPGAVSGLRALDYRLAVRALRDGREAVRLAGPVETDQLAAHAPRHATNGPPLAPYPPLSVRRPHSGAGLAVVRQYIDAVSVS